MRLSLNPPHTPIVLNTDKCRSVWPSGEWVYRAIENHGFVTIKSKRKVSEELG